MDDAVASASEQDVKKLDDMIWKTETERLYDHPFLPPLRFYVYVMPKEFTYDLLTLFRNTYRETSNLTSNEGSSGDSNDFDSMIASIRDLDIAPETIRSFLPKVNWERLASMYVPGRSGAECEARFLDAFNGD
ncbi:hypothetical protein RHGRI_036128 [Rhododendron griersonianum]|uniref:Uncharacterized protein n=1 Tax=Rhododendron griersonianum TaxID=479676 RepID=A0AAV6HLV3_9ERIC|nr:hypothetical protein RHGRI_036128 [Rhododendron griersonianum]